MCACVCVQGVHAYVEQCTTSRIRQYNTAAEHPRIAHDATEQSRAHQRHAAHFCHQLASLASDAQQWRCRIRHQSTRRPHRHQSAHVSVRRMCRFLHRQTTERSKDDQRINGPCALGNTVCTYSVCTYRYVNSRLRVSANCIYTNTPHSRTSSCPTRVFNCDLHVSIACDFFNSVQFLFVLKNSSANYAPSLVYNIENRNC